MNKNMKSGPDATKERQGSHLQLARQLVQKSLSGHEIYESTLPRGGIKLLVMDAQKPKRLVAEFNTREISAGADSRQARQQKRMSKRERERSQAEKLKEAAVELNVFDDSDVYKAFEEDFKMKWEELDAKFAARERSKKGGRHAGRDRQHNQRDKRGDKRQQSRQRSKRWADVKETAQAPPAGAHDDAEMPPPAAQAQQPPQPADAEAVAVPETPAVAQVADAGSTAPPAVQEAEPAAAAAVVPETTAADIQEAPPAAVKDPVQPPATTVVDGEL